MDTNKGIANTYFIFYFVNQCLVLLAIATSASITGTSTNTPTTVASAAPELSPNKAMATATANSKKLLAPIIAPGAAISWGNFHALAHKYAKKNIKNVCIVSGIAINAIWAGLSIIFWPWKANNITNVNNKPTTVIPLNLAKIHSQNNLILFSLLS